MPAGVEDDGCGGYPQHAAIVCQRIMASMVHQTGITARAIMAQYFSIVLSPLTINVCRIKALDPTPAEHLPRYISASINSLAARILWDLATLQHESIGPSTTRDIPFVSHSLR